MVSLSKIFNQEIRFRQCNELIHSNGCIKNAFFNIYRLFISNLKYNIPFFLFPLLANVHKIDRKRFQSVLFQYFENVTCTTSVGWFVLIGICVVRQIMGEFQKQMSFRVPCIFGGCLSLLFSERIKQFFRYGIIQCDIESHILQRKNIITKSIANSKIIQTFLFMCSSALILYGKQQRIHRNFWLVSPPSKTAKKTNQICDHKEKQCSIYFLKGLSTYLVIGLSFDVIKSLMNKTKHGNGNASGFMFKIWAKLCNLNLSSTAFMCSYVSIYRLFHCYFNQQIPNKLAFNHFLAAFLSGCCYAFQPKLILLGFSITSATDVLWKLLKRRKISKENQILNFIINRLYISNIIYVAALCHLVENYVLENHHVGKVGAALCGGITNYAGEKVQRNIQLYAEI